MYSDKVNYLRNIGEPTLTQKEFNEILKSKGYKLNSLEKNDDCDFIYNINKLKEEKITTKEIHELLKFKGVKITFLRYESDKNYIRFYVDKFKETNDIE